MKVMRLCALKHGDHNGVGHSSYHWRNVILSAIESSAVRHNIRTGEASPVSVTLHCPASAICTSSARQPMIRVQAVPNGCRLFSRGGVCLSSAITLSPSDRQGDHASSSAALPCFAA